MKVRENHIKEDNNNNEGDSRNGKCVEMRSYFSLIINLFMGVTQQGNNI